MTIRLLRTLTLKQRVFGFMALLGFIPIAAFALTYYSIWKGRQVEDAMAVANSGAFNLIDINAHVYAVVMDSRGIYMSKTWKEAKPFADGMERNLVKLNQIMERWKTQNIIESERQNIAALEKSVAQFTSLRRELIQRAAAEDLAGARALGDNETNRNTRKAMNALVSKLTEKYMEHEKSAQAMKNDVERQNVFLLTALAISALVIGVLGAYTLNRTVIGLFNRMRKVMVELAAGNLKVEFTGGDRQDEIGDFARAFHKFKTDAMAKERMEAQARETAERTEAERQRKEAQDAERGAAQARALECFARALHTLAEGDLGARISEDVAPDFEALKADFNATVERLRDVLQKVAENSSIIAGGTQQITAGASDLAQRTEQQAASLEQTAAALDEITATVRKTSDGASQAQDMAATTKASADKATDIVRKAVEAVGGIERSSQQISQIIGVIDEIAFQTNLLALNAGVEAARAGDSGRGFAVVASEVRALAQRSAAAAKEIKGLIAASSAQVVEGVALVGETGRSLQEILAQVTQITGIISEMAIAAREQATGLAEVNTSVNEMDTVTQRNATMVHETSNASRSLAEKTAEMSELVAHFRFGAAQRPQTVHASVTSAPAHKPQAPVVRAGGARRSALATAQKAEVAAADDDWQDF